MAKYLIDSTDIEIEEVSGTENLKFNLASGNSTEQLIGNLSNLNTTSKSNVVNAINEVNQNQINSNTYSTTETVIGKWIDKKPIYRKVINTGALPNATTNDIPHYINNIDKIKNIRGYAFRSSDNFTIPLPFSSPDNIIYSVSLGVLGNNIRISTATDRTAFAESYVILEYTKTTN